MLTTMTGYQTGSATDVCVLLLPVTDEHDPLHTACLSHPAFCESALGHMLLTSVLAASQQVKDLVLVDLQHTGGECVAHLGTALLGHRK